MLNYTHATMGAGKSAILIAKATSTKHCIITKPKTDTRTEGTVWSRNGLTLDCDFLLDEDTDIWGEIEKKGLEDIKYIYVDEAQFLSDKNVEDLLRIGIEKNIIVETFGLLTNFQAELFDGSKRLIELADNISCITSYDKHGLQTKQNGRFVDGKQVFVGPEIMVGKDEYAAMSNDIYFTNKWKEEEK